MKNKPVVHFIASQLHDPSDQIKIIVIGAGGTGSRLVSLLADLNYSLIARNHPGLQVTLFDNAVVREANLRRQRFADSEVGQLKAGALITRINRFYGTQWTASQKRFCIDQQGYFPDGFAANLYISCVDTTTARFQIAEILCGRRSNRRCRDYALYWLDLGNNRYTGQGVLSTLNSIPQPTSEKFISLSTLPMVTEEYRTALKNIDDDNEPSCSMVDAESKQDLFVNAQVATLGASLIRQLLTESYIDKRGFFFDLQDLSSQPIRIKIPESLKISP